VTRHDAVPLRTSLKQGKRQKPVPHHRPALTGRKSSMGEFLRALFSPLRLPGLGVLQIWIPLINRTHKSGLELQAGPDGAILQGGYSEFWMKNVPSHWFEVRRQQMLYWALMFLIIALIAAFLGFAGVATAAAGIAKILFYIFLIVFLVTLIMGLGRRGTRV